ncbi:hypothetical protein BDV59DRAFT_203682 [Aspergillus ambiguus]|uniref:uncharacterized protein n=1 Tax=Aspergillus ambiguus TaxID=176160 RepID=UPI003CCD0B0F
MISPKTFLGRICMIGCLPAATVAQECQPNPSSNSICTSNRFSQDLVPSTASYSVPWPTLEITFPTFHPSDPDPDPDTGPQIPTPVIVLLPAITGFSIMLGLWLCYARRKPRGADPERRGHPASAETEEMSRGTRRQGLQPQTPINQREMDVGEITEVDEAPPPYSREPPK